MLFGNVMKEILKALPIKDIYQKKDLLIDELLIKKEENIEVYYAPFDYVNKDAVIALVGITPGFIQMKNSYQYYLSNQANFDDMFLQMKTKKHASFSGPIRQSLIQMLDKIKLNDYLNIKSCQELFGCKNYLIHTTSILKYPVFINKETYNGSKPSILNNKFLFEMIENQFIEELNQLKEDVVIIPIGKVVSDVLKYLIDHQLIINKRICNDFLHSSFPNTKIISESREKLSIV